MLSPLLLSKSRLSPQEAQALRDFEREFLIGILKSRKKSSNLCRFLGQEHLFLALYWRYPTSCHQRKHVFVLEPFFNLEFDSGFGNIYFPIMILFAHFAVSLRLSEESTASKCSHSNPAWEAIVLGWLWWYGSSTVEHFFVFLRVKHLLTGVSFSLTLGIALAGLSPIVVSPWKLLDAHRSKDPFFRFETQQNTLASCLTIPRLPSSDLSGSLSCWSSCTTAK